MHYARGKPPLLTITFILFSFLIFFLGLPRPGLNTSFVGGLSSFQPFRR